MTTHIPHKTKLLLTISWVLAILWMLLIFALSTQPATQSNKLSENFAKAAITSAEKLEPASAPITQPFLDKINNEIRNFAHGGVFLILTLLIFNALRRSHMKTLPSLILTLLICIIYAILDEYHQSFVPGRGYELSDFIRDSIGILIGLGIVLLVGFVLSRMSRRELKDS